MNLAAHELRTPIQPILGLSEAILTKDKSIDFTHYHNVILRNARRLQTLTENILDVTKIEANNVRLKKGAVDLHSLISVVIKDFQHQIADYLQEKEQDGESEQAVCPIRMDVKILLRPDVNDFQLQGSGQEQYNDRHHFTKENPENKAGSPPPLMIIVDRNRITQVLNNLIINALWSVTNRNKEINDRKVGGSTNERRNLAYVEVSTQKDSLHNRVIVTVRDNGSGISEDVIPKLFTKFATKNEQGLGLGLYISKGIVEAHGGTIWAENKKGEETNGAVFRFTLPFEEA
jgi:signal transduction histidine kinase